MRIDQCAILHWFLARHSAFPGPAMTPILRTLGHRAVVLAAVLLGCGGGLNEPSTSVAQFEQRLEELRAQSRIPAITAVITSGQEVVWVRALGTADLATGRLATDTTVYHLASITKTFASPPRLSRRVEGSGAASTLAARSLGFVAGAFGAVVAFETAPRAVLLMERRRGNRAKTCTSAAPRHVLPSHLMRTRRVTGSESSGGCRWGRSRSCSTDWLRAGGLERRYASLGEMSHLDHGAAWIREIPWVACR